MNSMFLFKCLKIFKFHVQIYSNIQMVEFHARMSRARLRSREVISHSPDGTTHDRHTNMAAHGAVPRECLYVQFVRSNIEFVCISER